MLWVEKQFSFSQAPFSISIWEAEPLSMCLGTLRGQKVEAAQTCRTWPSITSSFYLSQPLTKPVQTQAEEKHMSGLHARIEKILWPSLSVYPLAINHLHYSLMQNTFISFSTSWSLTQDGSCSGFRMSSLGSVLDLMRLLGCVFPQSGDLWAENSSCLPPSPTPPHKPQIGETGIR